MEPIMEAEGVTVQADQTEMKSDVRTWSELKKT